MAEHLGRMYRVDDIDVPIRAMFPHLSDMFDELDEMAGTPLIRPDMEVQDYRNPNMYQRRNYGIDRKKRAMKQIKSKYATKDFFKLMGTTNLQDALDQYRALQQIQSESNRNLLQGGI